MVAPVAQDPHGPQALPQQTPETQSPLWHWLPAVHDELTEARTPEKVRRCVLSLPAWYKVQKAPENQTTAFPITLHRGEREGTPEVLLAAIARTVSELDHDPLPAELELQVRELLDLYLEGNQKEEA